LRAPPPAPAPELGSREADLALDRPPVRATGSAGSLKILRVSFLEYVEANAAVCDGAMQTKFYANWAFVNRSFDELNLSFPIWSVRCTRSTEEYLRVGRRSWKPTRSASTGTNSGPHGLGERVREIDAAGVRITREVPSGAVYVAT